MRYVKIDNSGNVLTYPYNEQDLRKEHPNTSFPKPVPDAALARYNVFPVTTLPRPKVDTAVEYVEPQTTPSKVGDDWQIGWNVRQFTPEQLTKREEKIADTRFNKEKKNILPDGYDEQDVEVLAVLCNELRHFDNGSQTDTPLCAKVAAEFGVDVGAIRDTVRARSDIYFSDVVTAWARRRKVKGGA